MWSWGGRTQPPPAPAVPHGHVHSQRGQRVSRAVREARPDRTVPREGPGKGLDVTYSVGDIPAEHHPGLLLGLLGPVQHEAKPSIDHLTPVGGKEFPRPFSRPAPAWSGRKCTHIWGTLWKPWLMEAGWLLQLQLVEPVSSPQPQGSRNHGAAHSPPAPPCFTPCIPHPPSGPSTMSPPHVTAFSEVFFFF